MKRAAVHAGGVQGVAAPAQAVDQRPAKKQKAARAAALDEEAEEAKLSLQEVFRRLRALEQPVTLFGEVLRSHPEPWRTPQAAGVVMRGVLLVL